MNPEKNYQIKWGKKNSAVFQDAKCLREEIFCKEQGFEDEFDEFDAVSKHMVLYDNDQNPIGTGRLLEIEPDVYKPGRIAVKKTLRGTGAGRIVVLALEEEAHALGATTILIGAQEQAVPFYERLGYVQDGEAYFEEHCKHLPMKKILAE